MHYGTFELTDESYHQPTIDLAQAKIDKNISNFITLEFGESLLYIKIIQSLRHQDDTSYCVVAHTESDKYKFEGLE